MKSKKATFFLIVSVACVWGIIFYKVFSASAAEDEYVFSPQTKPVKYEPLDGYLNPDTLQLSLNYADPFLKDAVAEALPEEEKVKAEIPVSPVRQFIPPAPQKPVINWGSIKYNGY
ncbi:MAG: hypothetical protein EOO01_36460, partial [Chitinophagaceae bacterium]